MRAVAGKERTALLAVLGICFMAALAFASVPLYRLFCEATGLNGTTNRALEAPGATDHRVVIQFDANVAPDMPWRFRPEARSDTVDIGARDLAFFLATNTSARSPAPPPTTSPRRSRASISPRSSASASPSRRSGPARPRGCR